MSSSGLRLPKRLVRSACLILSLGLAGCDTGKSGGAEETAPPPAGPPVLDVVRVLQQPTDVVLTMPGQLDPYESVAMYPKVTGFVKTMAVDRGSRVHTGDLMAELEAPELVSQRGEAQSKLQAAEAQLATARAKTDADTGTYVIFLMMRRPP